jgi:hypothetical protein
MNIYNIMAFTRFHDDPLRIAKRLEELTFTAQYQLDVPGPGMNLPFECDPNHRLQKWGANLQTNTINLESDLRGMTRQLNRDSIENNNYKLHAVQSADTRSSYPVANPYVEESRASHPAWTFRDKEQSRWETPILNPQTHLEKPFNHNIQTRILEKDKFR